MRNTNNFTNYIPTPTTKIFKTEKQAIGENVEPPKLSYMYCW